jgi:hypothetical protein
MSGPSTYRHSVPQQLAAVDALAVILRKANERTLESISRTVSDLGSTLVGRDTRPVGEAHRRVTFQGCTPSSWRSFGTTVSPGTGQGVPSTCRPG